ncbi:MAG: DoxX family protein [Gemmatimonadetes bacterium]|nr:DoxX family protein [Gemmatimonadota bacterium]
MTTTATHLTATDTTRPAWLTQLLHTTDDVAPTVARLTLGLIMLPHGLQKTLGWFGGYGYAGTMGFFTETMGIPALFAFLAFLAIVAESLGALALITGVLTRVAAAGIGIVMLVAALTAHLPNGLFMNWSGTQAGEGFEYHLLAIGLALVALIKGGGRASIDGVLNK